MIIARLSTVRVLLKGPFDSSRTDIPVRPHTESIAKSALLYCYFEKERNPWCLNTAAWELDNRRISNVTYSTSCNHIDPAFQKTGEKRVGKKRHLNFPPRFHLHI
jgi:hypothetical protein